MVQEIRPEEPEESLESMAVAPVAVVEPQLVKLESSIVKGPAWSEV